MPACLRTEVSVRTSRAHHCDRCAQLVQIFWPETTNSSPSATARVRSDARSEPAFGSENPWHQMSSPDRSRGSSSRRCRSLP